jgi:hypothetical protein
MPSSSLPKSIENFEDRRTMARIGLIKAKIPNRNGLCLRQIARIE